MAIKYLSNGIEAESAAKLSQAMLRGYEPTQLQKMTARIMCDGVDFQTATRLAKSKLETLAARKKATQLAVALEAALDARRAKARHALDDSGEDDMATDDLDDDDDCDDDDDDEDLDNEDADELDDADIARCMRVIRGSSEFAEIELERLQRTSRRLARLEAALGVTPRKRSASTTPISTRDRGHGHLTLVTSAVEAPLTPAKVSELTRRLGNEVAFEQARASGKLEELSKPIALKRSF